MLIAGAIEQVAKEAVLSAIRSADGKYKTSKYMVVGAVLL
jgi:hypothetical protein